MTSCALDGILRGRVLSWKMFPNETRPSNIFRGSKMEKHQESQIAIMRRFNNFWSNVSHLKIGDMVQDETVAEISIALKNVEAR